MATSAAPAATGTSAAATVSPADKSRTTIAQNFNSFLLLLTTQLKNQNPLEPLDTNQFTQQLVQFASVEQQLKSNDTLNALLTSAKSTTASNAAGFVGMQITADGATTTLSKGKAEWVINPAKACAQATVTIRDAKGNVVSSKTQALAAGSQTFAWDGKDTTGLQVPPGDYTISVTGRDAAGQPVSVKTEISGRVDGVDLSGDAPILLVGSAQVPLAKVKGLKSGS
ncbi:MAG TPA: flagellar hook capping FlgD N-terminal domain-containing protein [Beijerinckiaceae bacterium]|jgi:flagellar basal-body rod modification protein FlgD